MDSVAESLVVQSLVKASSSAGLAIIDYWEDLNEDYDPNKDEVKKMSRAAKAKSIDRSIPVDDAMSKQIAEMKEQIAKKAEEKKESDAKRKMLRK